MSDGNGDAGAVLSCAGLVVMQGSAKILKDIDLTIPRGSLTVIIGPNGCGKSTLLRSLARVITPRSGQVLLDGRPIAALPTKEVARRLALLPQSPIAPEGMTLRELVALGRHPHRRTFACWSQADDKAVNDAIDRMQLSALRHRPLDTLSGGQRQRAWIALTLAQDTDLILMDEPTTYLDLKVQVELMDLLGTICRTGKTLILVLHDLTLAAAYADHLVLMRDGRILAEGPPARVMTPELLRQVFDLDARVIPDPDSARPVILPRIAA